jgi:hypothetical protein
MNFNHIVRQWNYIGGILNPNTLSNKLSQNYQIFNEIRHDFYKRFRTVNGYPAATGIGNRSNGATIDIYAIHASKQVNDVAVNNPKQINPYHYSQAILAGEPIRNQKVKHGPAFERARLLAAPHIYRLFVSGTASIIGQETIGIGNVEKQALNTINIIKTLVDDDNVTRCLPHFKGNNQGFSYLRVYVKNSSDLEIVKSIFRSSCKGVPISFVLTDICRDDLLLEVEGEIQYFPAVYDQFVQSPSI